MKFVLCGFGFGVLGLLSLSDFQVPAAENQSAGGGISGGIEAFVGRWDLTIKEGNRELPSWLEVLNDHGRPKANFVGRWGSARLLSKVAIQGAEIHFISPKEEEGSSTDLYFQGKVIGGAADSNGNSRKLVGTAQGPNGMPWTWTGKRAPELKPSATPAWGQPIRLFNDKDFNGWTFDNPSKASSWKVTDGCLVNAAAGSNITTEQKFGNFKLHIEVNCPAKANSGIYLRGRYEVQVEDDSLDEPPSHHMGAIYGFLAPMPEQPRRPGAWQTFDITLLGRHVTVVQNGQTIIENREIPGITGGAIDSHEELPGPIYLQGDHGGIAYRNVVLTPVER
jgi:hypothetical protein